MVANPFYKTDEFKDLYKQALFEILIKKFVVFRDNNYKLQNKPKECTEKCNAYMAISDDFYGWFDDYFEKTPTIEESNPLTFKDIYNIFKNSDFFANLSKADKRAFNQRYFNSKIEENIFLRKYVKLRDTYHNQKKINTDYIIGWVRKSCGDGVVIDDKHL